MQSVVFDCTLRRGLKLGYFFKLSKKLRITKDGLHYWDITYSGFTQAVRLVKESIKQRFFRSTNKPKYCRKSAPIIGFLTFATINGHCKVRLNLKSSDNYLVSNVAILVPSAAYKTKSFFVLSLVKNDLG
ncbi:hypothetical protein AVEN_203260-1 [Araneus ventricosus]|uniref:Uncharacterized protein n=1 Tax=Araneus ventricosus TaxID=182803 RepID=A0A4Y2JA51_ARAVE|nr:hypothetical protein AVEN_203260-1 [Araneus ventricosus]